MTNYRSLAAATFLIVFGYDISSGQIKESAALPPIEGFSQPARLAKVACSARGILQSFHAKEGQAVKKGECIGKIDSAVQLKLVEMARVAKDCTGEIVAAEATLRAKKMLLHRVESLLKRNHASEIELLKAQEQVESAESSLQIVRENQMQRQAEYEKLLAEAQQCCISAPFDGVVVEYLKEHGEYVGPADPNVCVLAELDVLSVEFLVPLSRRHECKVGEIASVQFVDSGTTATGRISYVSPYPNGETNLFTVKVRIENEKRKLQAGMRCQLDTNGSRSSVALATP